VGDSSERLTWLDPGDGLRKVRQVAVMGEACWGAVPAVMVPAEGARRCLVLGAAAAAALREAVPVGTLVSLLSSPQTGLQLACSRMLPHLMACVWRGPSSTDLCHLACAADGGEAVPWLNELEWVDGQVWANIWHTECIAQIDPATGHVTGWALLGDLRKHAEQVALADGGPPLHQEGVLNGIAYDEERGRLFLTGKLWPRVYQVDLVEVEDAAKAAAALRQARQQCIKRGNLHIGR
jgi:hypothetical protein